MIFIKLIIAVHQYLATYLKDGLYGNTYNITYVYNIINVINKVNCKNSYIYIIYLDSYNN